MTEISTNYCLRLDSATSAAAPHPALQHRRSLSSKHGECLERSHASAQVKLISFASLARVTNIRQDAGTHAYTRLIVWRRGWSMMLVATAAAAVAFLCSCQVRGAWRYYWQLLYSTTSLSLFCDEASCNIVVISVGLSRQSYNIISIRTWDAVTHAVWKTTNVRHAHYSIQHVINR